VQRLEALRLRRTLEGIETALAAQDCLLADGFSAADIMAGSSAELARRFVPLDGLDRVSAWLKRLTARPGYRAAQAADGPAVLYLQDFYGLPHA
jgi:glutathione S-transferase